MKKKDQKITWGFIRDELFCRVRVSRIYSNNSYDGCIKKYNKFIYSKEYYGRGGNHNYVVKFRFYIIPVIYVSNIFLSCLLTLKNIYDHFIMVRLWNKHQYKYSMEIKNKISKDIKDKEYLI